MILDEEAKELVRAFRRAASRAVAESPEAQRALEALRGAGFDAVLRIRLLSSASAADVAADGTAFTDADLKELGRMSIRIK